MPVGTLMILTPALSVIYNLGIYLQARVLRVGQGTYSRKEVKPWTQRKRRKLTIRRTA